MGKKRGTAKKKWGIFVTTKNDEELSLWFESPSLRDAAAAQFVRQNATVKKTRRN